MTRAGRRSNDVKSGLGEGLTRVGKGYAQAGRGRTCVVFTKASAPERMDKALGGVEREASGARRVGGEDGSGGGPQAGEETGR